MNKIYIFQFVKEIHLIKLAVKVIQLLKERVMILIIDIIQHLSKILMIEQDHYNNV
jgi:hypothetical protein